LQKWGIFICKKHPKAKKQLALLQTVDKNGLQEHALEAIFVYSWIISTIILE